MKKDSDELKPSIWLWQEIERRFGHDAAMDLRQTFNARMKAYERGRRLAQYREELAMLERRLQEVEGQGKATKNILNKIAHRKKRLAQG